jgi:hypothetical protein
MAGLDKLIPNQTLKSADRWSPKGKQYWNLKEKLKTTIVLKICHLIG